ncbi:ABC transporter ATP-binding protein [Aeromicrobium sp. CF4.19]|uniref:ABC transporter ATP-binding protein n=1 Tax=Aeromicrobium sp. CF4.19 TaxID=3373082 RepID=UPI003EE50D00
MTAVDAPRRELLTLAVEGLQVRLGSFVLGPLDLEITPGITALLGPNGSGKTTLLRAVNGLIPSARGTAHVGGSDLMSRSVEGRRRAAFVPDGDELLFSELTLDQFFSFVARVRERSFGDDPDVLFDRAATLSVRFQLDPGTTRMRDFSMGMKRKAQLITGMMADPDLLMIDEPQNGLDFVSSREIRTALSDLCDDGATIVMSNHDLDSVARIADHVVIVNDGRVVAASDEPFSSGAECERFVAGYFET